MLLALSVPTSETGITASMVLLLAGWLADNQLYKKIKTFFRSKTALAFALLYFVHIAWLINTSDYNYAILDLRTKFSIFLFSLIFSTTPMISAKEFRNVMLVHALTVFITSIIGVYRYLDSDLVDFRNFSPFISHIRFSLNICIAVFTFIYYSYHSEKSFNCIPHTKKGIKLIFYVFSLWLFVFMVLMQSFTGLIITLSVLFFGLIWYVINSVTSRYIKLSVFILIITIPLAFYLYFYNSFKEYMSRPVVNFNSLGKFTKKGNEYRHDTTYYGLENGKWTGLYLCESEMRETWNKRSLMKYDSLDDNGFYVSSTIIRYLTSKDLRKDEEGINSLSDEDVSNIEKGIATKESLQGWGIRSRLNTIFFELMRYETDGEIKGSSIIQRYELLKNSLNIISDNFFTGVGTGDVPYAFKQQLNRSGSPLKDTRMRSHNQYLSLFISFGLLGFLLCVFSFVYPYLKSGQDLSYFTVVFLIVFFLSNLSEDTIESLAGATFYSFFGAMYLFQQPQRPT